MSGAVRDTRPHRHHAIQLSLSVGRPFSIDHGRRSLLVRSVLIRPDTPHRIYGEDEQLLLLVERESEGGHGLIDALGKEEVRAEPMPVDGIDRIAALASDRSRPLHEILDAALRAIGAKPCACGRRDARIDRVVGLIDSAHGRSFRLGQLAAELNISLSRLEHIFKEGTGIPLKRYLLWRRITNAAGIMAEGCDLTSSAMDAGFFDSAHLSRAFKEFFGMRPSHVFKDSRSVQVFRE